VANTEPVVGIHIVGWYHFPSIRTKN